MSISDLRSMLFSAVTKAGEAQHATVTAHENIAAALGSAAEAISLGHAVLGDSQAQIVMDGVALFQSAEMAHRDAMVTLERAQRELLAGAERMQEYMDRLG